VRINPRIASATDSVECGSRRRPAADIHDDASPARPHRRQHRLHRNQRSVDVQFGDRRERSLAVRGVVAGSETLTPDPASGATDNIDSSHGTVHMILGGGGVSGTTNQSFFTDGTGKVITAVSATADPTTGKRVSTHVKEQAVWSAVRDLEHPYGFAAFTVDPGRRPGDTTTMYVTYYNVNKPSGQLSVFEKFSLHRRRSDG
jgi:hypothetical protein